MPRDPFRQLVIVLLETVTSHSSNLSPQRRSMVFNERNFDIALHMGGSQSRVPERLSEIPAAYAQPHVKCKALGPKPEPEPKSRNPIPRTLNT